MPKRSKITREMKGTLLRLYQRYGTEWSEWTGLVIDGDHLRRLQANGLVDHVDTEDVPEPDGKDYSFRVTARGKMLLDRCGLLG